MRLVELIKFIEKRPYTFLVEYSIYDLDAFLRGYGFYKSYNDLQDEEDKLFCEFKNTWIKKRLNLPEHKSFAKCLLFESDNQAKALDRFFQLWSEFIEESNK